MPPAEVTLLQNTDIVAPVVVPSADGPAAFHLEATTVIAADPSLYLSPALNASVFPLPGINFDALGALTSSIFSSLAQDPYSGFNLNNPPLRTYCVDPIGAVGS
jgi:hypothetical protein